MIAIEASNVYKILRNRYKKSPASLGRTLKYAKILVSAKLLTFDKPGWSRWLPLRKYIFPMAWIAH